MPSPVRGNDEYSKPKTPPCKARRREKERRFKMEEKDKGQIKAFLDLGFVPVGNRIRRDICPA
jgi:hypothetical protein